MSRMSLLFGLIIEPNEGVNRLIGIEERIKMTEQWLWQHEQWPHFRWRDAELRYLLNSAYERIGRVKGKMSVIGDSDDFSLDTLLTNIVASSAIESEQVDVYAVRSSLARQLNLADQQPTKTTLQSDGLASLMRAAVTDLEKPLSLKQLLDWHAWLFQGQQDGLMQRVAAGELRGNAPMQIVSGPLTRPKVHFVAPPRDRVDQELERFIEWFNASASDNTFDPIIRAALVHLWFVTVHPFEDGNGRITRALTDRALAQLDKQSIRLFAMSEAILANRERYYEILELTQKSDLDVTDWVCWFVEMLIAAIDLTLAKIERTLNKARFWGCHADLPLLDGQRKVVNRLLDGDFEHGISATQYQRVAKVSKATATRHLTELLDKGLMCKLPGGGRSTRYQIAMPT